MVQHKSYYKKALHFLTPYKTQFIISQIFTLISAGVAVAFPLAIKNIFDSTFIDKNVQILFIYISILAGVFFIGEVTKYIKNYMLGLIGQNIITDIRVKVYKKLQRMTMGYYDKNKSGDIVSSLTNDISMVQQALSTGVTFILQQVITLVIVLYMLIRLNAVLTVVSLATLPIIILCAKKMGNKARSVSMIVQNQLGNITSIMNESIAGIGVIKAFVLEKQATHIFAEKNKELLSHSIQNVKNKEKTGMITGLLNALQLVIITGIGGYQVIQGVITPGGLIAFILFLEMITGPIAMLSGIYVEIQKSLAAMQRVFDILDNEEIEKVDNKLNMDKSDGSIYFQNVNFSYQSPDKILNDINFSIPKGEIAAFVGPSGVGKSTIFKLIPRFYEADSGIIKVGNMNIKDIDIESLRKNIAIVPQDTYLFGMSIKDNILCGNPNASKREMIKAAKLANAHEFINKMPDKYDTVLGERGATLSGGQRQRVSIARAFMKDPKILLLDEATSSLDTHSEKKVQQAIDKLMKNRTTLIIAHRLSTIENAHKVFVMDQGEIIASGTHQQLLKTCSLYYSLYQSQFSGAS